MITVGITGRSGSGKSSLGRYYAQKGYPVADGDEISRFVTKAGSPCVKQLCAEFGSEIVNEQGELQRQKLAEIAFSSPEKTANLNKIVHPFIMEEFEMRRRKAEKENNPLFFLDGAAIIDTPFQQKCDTIITVVADPKLSIMRIVLRDGISKTSAEKRLQAQTSEARLRQAADFVLPNDESQEAFYKRADAILESLLQLEAAEKSKQKG